MLTRIQARRLRDIHRSAGWPCQDAVEIELLAAGLVVSLRDGAGRETLRLTEPGIQALAQSLAGNRQARSAHEILVERVAAEMTRAGRIAWRGLSLRAQVPDGEASEAGGRRWCLAMPDVFSVRNTTVEDYLEPIVHEIKVRRADLLGDLRNGDKRAAYLDLGGECWYVLGQDARGRPIALADEIPAECGVLQQDGARLVVLRAAPRRPHRLPFAVWMALAKATPVTGFDEAAQGLLGDADRHA